MPRLSPSKVTNKQLHRIQEIIGRVGKDRVVAYLHKFAHESDLSTMTRGQAQRIIIGLDYLMPRSVGYGRRKGYGKLK